MVSIWQGSGELSATFRIHFAGTVVKLQARIPEVLTEGAALTLGVEEFVFNWILETEGDET